MKEREKWESINKCETFEELAQAVILIGQHSDDGDTIQDRRKPFKASDLAYKIRMYNRLPTPSYLTKSYGIRQQAMYIQWYEMQENK